MKNYLNNLQKLGCSVWRYRNIFLVVGLLLLLFSSCVRRGNTAPGPRSDTLELTQIINETLEIRILESSGDVEQVSSGGVNSTSKGLNLGLQPYVGMRFTDLTIPQGAAITNAYIQFKVDASRSGTSNLTIQAEDSDNAPPLQTSNFYLSSLNTTSAEALWSPPNWTTVGETGPDQQTSDISSVLQEVINKPGWSSGNALVILISGTGERVAESYNGDQSGAPLLHVEYSYEDSPPRIDSFSVTPNPAGVGEQVTFSWSVSDPQNQALSCTLDVNADGNFEYSFADCYSVTSQSHTYGTRGIHTARLIVTDIDDSIAESIIEVNIDTIEVQITTGSDDAHQVSSGGVNSTSKGLNLGLQPYVGMRFTGLTIPQGATITNAYIQFKVDASRSGTSNLTIQAEDSDNAPPLQTSNSYLSSLNTTSAQTLWSPPNWTTVGEAGPDQQTSDISPVLQEVINKPSWSSGNALVILISGTGERVAESYNGDQSGAPLLHVEYSYSPPRIDSFSVTPNPAGVGEQVTFSWSVSDPQNQALSCTLDVNADGNFEYSFADCYSVTSQSHTYGTRGIHTARLIVTDIDDSIAESIIEVNIDIIEAQITTGSDDAHQVSSGGVNRTAPVIELGLRPYAGLRFTDINIPQGAAITNAYIQFKVGKVRNVTSNLTIQADASDNAAVLLSSNSNLSSRPKTLAQVPWSPPIWTTVGEAGLDQKTSDISPVLQEVINRPGWSSGNDLVILITGSGEHIAESYDGDPSGAPILHVEFATNIGDFTTNPSIVGLNEQVTFSWVLSNPQNHFLSCTLDIDDDGVVDYSYTSCNVTSQAHSYTQGGSYTAKLIVTNESTNVTSQKSTTVAIASTSNSVTIAAAGDIACDPSPSNAAKFNGGQGTDKYCHMQAVADLMLTMNLDAVLPLGDNQYSDGTLYKFNNSYDLSWGQLKSITYPAVGNHEYLDPNAAGYFAYFGAAAGDPTKGYYSFDLGAWHFIVLNSQCGQIGGCKSWSPQGQWLIQDLATNATPCTLAYWHIPRFSSGALGNKLHSEDFWEELYDAGADLILAGHDHFYERFAPMDPNGELDTSTGIRSFVVGTGGKSLEGGSIVQPNSEVRNAKTYGVLKLTLHPTSYDWEFEADPTQNLPPNEKLEDSGTGQCH